MSIDSIAAFNDLPENEKDALRKVMERNDSLLDKEIRRVKKLSSDVDELRKDAKNSMRKSRIGNNAICFVCQNQLGAVALVTAPRAPEGECSVCKRSACKNCSTRYDNPLVRLCPICDKNFLLHAKSGNWFYRKILSNKSEEKKIPIVKAKKSPEDVRVDTFVREITGVDRINQVCSDTFMDENNGAWVNVSSRLNTAVNFVRSGRTGAIKKDDDTLEEWSDLAVTVNSEQHSAPPEDGGENDNLASFASQPKDYQKKVLNLTTLLAEIDEALNAGRITEEKLEAKSGSQAQAALGDVWDDDDKGGDNEIVMMGSSGEIIRMTQRQYRNNIRRVSSSMADYDKIYRKKEQQQSRK